MVYPEPFHPMTTHGRILTIPYLPAGTRKRQKTGTGTIRNRNRTLKQEVDAICMPPFTRHHRMYGDVWKSAHGLRVQQPWSLGPSRVPRFPRWESWSASEAHRSHAPFYLRRTVQCSAGGSTDIMHTMPSCTSWRTPCVALWTSDFRFQISDFTAVGQCL